MKRIAVVVALVAADGCCRVCPPEPPVVVIDTDASPLSCGDACTNLHEHFQQCEEGQREVDACTLFCEHTQRAGVSNLHPVCVAHATTLAELRACGVRCAQ